MKDCQCGKPVKLRAFRITIDRKPGVANYIEHTDGSSDCAFLKRGKWDCVSMKPYAKREEDKPSFQLLKRWEASTP